MLAKHDLHLPTPHEQGRSKEAIAQSDYRATLPPPSFAIVEQ